MRSRSDPKYVSEARQYLTAARKRADRQAKRVERIQSEGRDSSSAVRLRDTLRRRERRAAKYLEMVLGWYQKHSRQCFPRQVRNRFINPRATLQTGKGKFAKWDEKVRAALEKQFPDAPHFRNSILALWEKYCDLGLPNAHFVSELAGGKSEVTCQRVWEMMLARHLDALGYRVTTSDEGPDFRIEHEGRTIWVEAICPEPKGVPQDYLEGPKPGEFKVGDVPHNEVLLRWTAAIKEKCEKLEDYRKKGIVGAGDGYIIAVNGCQLGALPLQHGVSQFPYALEAVYPAGPIAIPVDKATGAFGQPFVSNRPKIETAKGKPVPTTIFLDKANAGVSAVMAFSHDRSEIPLLPLDVVHNHYASAPIPKQIFGPAIEEWGTEPDGKGGINVKKLPAPKAASQSADASRPG
jgi:hypothetical protein